MSRAQPLLVLNSVSACLNFCFACSCCLASSHAHAYLFSGLGSCIFPSESGVTSNFVDSGIFSGVGSVTSNFVGSGTFPPESVVSGAESVSSGWFKSGVNSRGLALQCSSSYLNATVLLKKFNQSMCVCVCCCSVYAEA